MSLAPGEAKPGNGNALWIRAYGSFAGDLKDWLMSQE